MVVTNGKTDRPTDRQTDRQTRQNHDETRPVRTSR